jgi:hypothetical protein
MPKDDRETYTLTLTPTPWPHDGRPGIIRLKHALKTLLRGFGLRCMEIDFHMPAQPQPPSPTPHQEPNQV